PITIRDPSYERHLAYIDDVVASLRTAAGLEDPPKKTECTDQTENASGTPEISLRYEVVAGSYRRVAADVVPEQTVTLGALAE
ncbi:MAG: hypothetical protein Q4C47_08980, partial [Planctomycetia bacterium]|nr:hypothetical protein [Planctomycetia bacterium]